jgi:mannitol/fructose-specific phosphotransferase system IIA component (Ntr-type)
MNSAELKISEVIQPRTVDLFLNNIQSKDEAIQYLAGLLDEAGLLVSKEDYLRSVYERETLGPTYMDNFIAIPHGKSAAVREAGIAFGRSHEGFYYATDSGGGLAKLIFLLAIPDRMSADAYIGVLARLARLLVHDEFREELMSSNSYKDVITAIINGEGILET